MVEGFHRARQIAGVPLVGHGLDDGFLHRFQASAAFHQHRVFGGINLDITLIEIGVIGRFAGALGDSFQAVF